jgi:glycosyltransferase involved in cell wall biosynthesis
VAVRPPLIDVIIPAYNEADAISLVIAHIPKALVRHVVVANNASTDATRAVAQVAGAIVVDQPQRGYGNACLRAMEQVAQHQPPPDVVVFLDADHSDHPEQMSALITPILQGRADLVIGSRALGRKQPGAMTPQQIFGNWLATRMIRWMYGVRFTDLGPFRAVRYPALLAIEMRDRTFGWTVEMQVKAAKMKLRCMEVPVDYRKRIGVSKVSGTVYGTVMAGYKIISTILKYR